MNANAPTLKVAECQQFLQLWTEVTDTCHVTLVAILPDSQGAHAKTSSIEALEDACNWIADHQRTGRNIYFQPNETSPTCVRKPRKADMVAVTCRFADIDPDDEHYPLVDERDRLRRLAELLSRNPDIAPTAIIDSGNGAQPLWAVTCEPLDERVLSRVEAETREIEAALGARGTHNIDRLLRLPGTLNFPNEKKRKLGRGITRAKLIFSRPNLYRADEAAALPHRIAQILSGSGLVRPKAAKANGAAGCSDGLGIAELIRDLKGAGAGSVATEDDLPLALQARLRSALVSRPRFAARWAGRLDDLTKAGRDDSRSGADISLAAMAQSAGFSPVEAGLIVCAFPHGKANGDAWTGDNRLRHVARSVLRSYGPNSPQEEEDWPEPVDFLASAELTGVPELKPDHLPDAIAPFVFDSADRMGVDPATVALTALVSCAAVASDDWTIQPKRADYTWVEAPRIWGAIVGDPSVMKSPVIKACTQPIDRLETEARGRHAEAMQNYRAEMAQWKKKQEGEEPKHPVLDRYMMENLTTEALSEVLRDDFDATQRAPARKVLVRSDELAELLADLDRYRAGGRGGGDRGAYLRLFNGGRHTVDRIGRGAFACPNWSACIVGGIQPGPIQRIAREAADDGMLQRFLYAVPARPGQGVDRAPDEVALQRYRALIPALAVLSPRGSIMPGAPPDSVRLHVDAHQHREAINELVEAMQAMPDTSDRMKAALGKIPGIYARLCLLFHLIEIADARARGQPGPVPGVLPEVTARRAMLYMREVLLPHVSRAHALMYLTPQTGHARWIAGHILSRGLSRVTRRDVTRAYHPLRPPEQDRELTSVMASLATMGWLREEEGANPSRPPGAWAVNPKVHTIFAARAREEREARKEAQAAMAEIIRKQRGG